MMQRTTKDEGASDFNPPFALPYPAPFTKYWYLGPVGQERLRALKDSRAQQQNSDKGSLDGAQADVRAGRERQVIIPDEEEEEEGVFKRSKAWNYVKVTGQGTAMHNGVMKAYKDIQ
jgi:hypothetical protein